MQYNIQAVTTTTTTSFSKCISYIQTDIGVPIS